VNPSGTPQVSGLADANLGGGASQDNGFLGALSSPVSNVPFPGTLYADRNAPFNAVFPLPPSPPTTVNYYFIATMLLVCRGDMAQDETESFRACRFL
jgi:hypothetical protein